MHHDGMAESSETANSTTWQKFAKVHNGGLMLLLPYIVICLNGHIFWKSWNFLLKFGIFANLHGPYNCTKNWLNFILWVSYPCWFEMEWTQRQTMIWKYIFYRTTFLFIFIDKLFDYAFKHVLIFYLHTV